MVGWMDDEALHRTLTTGRATYWSRSRQEYWRKGDTSGNVQHVREVRLDCDGDAVLVRSTRSAPPATPATRTCFDADLLLARRREQPACAPAHAADPAQWPPWPAIAPDLDDVPRAGARPPGHPGDPPAARRRRDAGGVYRKLAGDRPGTFLLESAEHGGVWSRYSFVGVRSHATLTERDGQAHWLGDAAGRRADRRRPAGRRCATTVAALHTERLPDLPPLTGGLVGYRLRRRAPARAAARPDPRRPAPARAGDDAGHRPGRARPRRRLGAADRQRRQLRRHRRAGRRGATPTRSPGSTG